VAGGVEPRWLFIAFVGPGAGGVGVVGYLVAGLLARWRRPSNRTGVPVNRSTMVITRRRGRAAGAVTGLVAAVLPLVACTAAPAPPAPAPAASAAPAATVTYTEAPCPSPNVPGVPQLDLGPEFRCGYLTVPEDRSDPGARTIRIAVARIGAAVPTPRPDPLVFLTGGPGGTALATAVPLVQGGLNRDREVIFLDQRGALHSDPLLSCPEIDAFAVEALGMSALDPATAARSTAATRTCRERLAGQGADLAAYDTAENAADVADLRTALGIAEWNVYGVSYGSDLALQLLRDHPEGIRSLVLDSVVPPQVNLIEGFWPNAAEGYRALFDACAAQPACAAAYPNLAGEFTAAVQRLAGQPLVVEEPTAPGGRVVIDGYTFANLVVVQSLSPGNYAGLPALIHGVATGDGQAAAEALVAGLPPPGLTGYGLTFGVFCREQIAFTDTGRIQAAGKRALPDFPAAVLALPPQAPRIVDDCGVWDVGAAAASVHDMPISDVPALLMSGSFDAVTPPSWAGLAAEGLPRSRLLVFPGLGHDVIAASDCGRTIMADFLEQPEGGYDTGCLDRTVIPPFTATAP
jgi:pimeloyl-ACP methyl ester carboxylesterase